jgi:hypothetical protein
MSSAEAADCRPEHATVVGGPLLVKDGSLAGRGRGGSPAVRLTVYIAAHGH